MAFESVANVSELPDGERIVVEMDDGELWVAIFNVNGKLYAIEDLCTHDDGPLAEGEIVSDGPGVECPRHGAIFSLETGKPTFPAVKPVRRFAVQVEGDDVQVDLTQVLA